MVTPVTCYVTVIPYCQPAVSLANVHTSYQTHASFRCRPCFVLHTNKVNCGFDSIYWRNIFIFILRCQMTFNAKGVTEIVKNIVSASYSTKDASRNCIYVLKLTVVMRNRLYIL